MSFNAFSSYLADVLSVLCYASTPSALLYVFADARREFELTVAGDFLELPLLDVAAWSKPSAGVGGSYRRAHELCAVFSTGTAIQSNRVELKMFGRDRMSVWDYPPPGDDPSAKPVAMLADIMRDCTKRGQLVVDTFVGSGSTFIAAEKTERFCFGIDLDPFCVDESVRRLQAFTGKDAFHLDTGQRFNDLAWSRLMHQEG